MEYLSKKTSKDCYTAEKCDKIIGQLERFRFKNLKIR